IGPYGAVYGTTTVGGGYGNIFAVRPSAHATTNVLGGWANTVLYSFTGGTDGSRPASDLIFDQAGNLYGATWNGGAYGKGTIYELARTPGGWEYRTIYSFTGAGDGAKPIANIMF